MLCFSQSQASSRHSESVFLLDTEQDIFEVQHELSVFSLVKVDM